MNTCETLVPLLLLKYTELTLTSRPIQRVRREHKELFSNSSKPYTATDHSFYFTDLFLLLCSGPEWTITKGGFFTDIIATAP